MTTVLYGNFEWDENKNILNQAKHGIRFEAGVDIFKNKVLEIRSKKPDTEIRFIAIGRQDPRGCIAVIYTQRGKRKRIISIRRARNNEEKIYETTFGSQEQ